MSKRSHVSLLCSTITNIWLISRKKWSVFSKKCSKIEKGIKIPSDLVYCTNEKLSNIEFSSGDIAQMISGLNKITFMPMIISIRMLNTFRESSYEP